MTGRRTLVTGGSRGIGAAIVGLLASQGHEIVLGYRADAEAAARTADAARGFGARCTLVQADVTDPQQVARLFAQAGAGLTGVVINAGGAFGIGPLADASPADIAATVALNLTSALLVAREAARALAISRGGRGGVIVPISSGAATLGSPNEFVAYAAAKAGVDTLARGLGLELARDGVRVVAIAPGLVDTGFHAAAGEPGRAERIAPTIPLGRGASAEEIAQAVAWAMSEAASYVTATVIRVAGGR